MIPAGTSGRHKKKARSYTSLSEKQLLSAQHVAFWAENFDADLKKMLDIGFIVKMRGEVGDNGRFVYFDKEYHPGTVVELSEVLGPKGELFRIIRASAVDWDGIDPVRPFPHLELLKIEI